MTYKKVIIFVGALVLLIVAIFSLSDDLLTPYVAVDFAKKNSGKLVQIIGKVDPAKPDRHTEKEFFFSIIDDKSGKVDIMYRGVKPLNFERADQIVCIGRYSSKDGMFIADKLLVKCPSKYENQYKERVTK